MQEASKPDSVLVGHLSNIHLDAALPPKAVIAEPAQTAISWISAGGIARFTFLHILRLRKKLVTVALGGC